MVIKVAKNYLTVNDLCKKLGIGKTTAYKLIKNKKIPSGRLGKKIVIKKSDLKKYIKEILHES